MGVRLASEEVLAVLVEVVVDDDNDDDDGLGGGIRGTSPEKVKDR